MSDSAQMPLRLPTSLHEELKKAAMYEGVSLNQYCLYLLALNVGRSASVLDKRAEDLFVFLEEAHVFQDEFQKLKLSKKMAVRQTPLQRLKKLDASN